MQTSLGKWFPGIKEKPQKPTKPKVITRYFYLSWKPNKSRPEQDAHWITESKYQELSDTFTIEKKIQLKTHTESKSKETPIEVIVCGDLDLNPTYPHAYTDIDNVGRGQDYRVWSNASLLKSFLQKCIRRGWEDKAVRTAFHLMLVNMMEFLRRFIIIAIEDSSTHPSLCTTLWFMAIGDIAYRREYIRYFLGLVYWVAIAPKRELWLPPESLELRISFGGMKCDMKRLERCITNLQPSIPYPRIKPIVIKRYLGLFEMDICGADFHVFPQMIDMLWEKYQEHYPEISQIEIKKAIWYNQSSLNFRDKELDISSKYSTTWMVIREDYQKIARQLIFSRG